MKHFILKICSNRAFFTIFVALGSAENIQSVLLGPSGRLSQKNLLKHLNKNVNSPTL